MLMELDVTFYNTYERVLLLLKVPQKLKKNQ